MTNQLNQSFNPIIAPGRQVEQLPQLSAPVAARYARQTILPEFGITGQQRLQNSRVLVVGAGGLGAPALLYLAGTGVGGIGIIDDDVVDLTNLHRQVIHQQKSVGQLKVESAKNAIAALNPLVKVETYAQRLTAKNAQEIISQYDVILDGADNFATRYLVSDACELAGVPHVWAAITGFQGQVSVFWGKPNNDAVPITYRDIFPDLPPVGAVPNCAEGGVLGVMCANVGALMANETVKLLTGIGTPLFGQLARFDALSGRWSYLRLSSDPERKPITEITPNEADENGLVVCQIGAEREVSPEELVNGGGIEKFVVVDVREASEIAGGTLPGAYHIPLGRFEGEGLPAELNAVLGAGSGQATSKDLLLYCQGGGRSAYVAQKLAEKGVLAYNLTGGFLAWQSHISA